MLEINGKPYDIEQEMYDTFKAQVDKKYAALPDAERGKALEKVLAAFAAPEKTYAKVQRLAALKADEDSVNRHKEIVARLPKLAKLYKTYIDQVAKLESEYNGKVEVDAVTGDVTLTIAATNDYALAIGKAVVMFAGAKITVGPESSDEGAAQVVRIKGNPEGVKAKRDAYLGMRKEVADIVPTVITLTNAGFNWDPVNNKIVVTDKTQRQAGAPGASHASSGEKASGGKVRWNGQEFEGTNKELFDKLSAAGFEFSESMVKWKTYSYITATDAHHCSKDIEVLERWTAEKKTDTADA